MLETDLMGAGESYLPPPYTSVGCIDEVIGCEAILAVGGSLFLVLAGTIRVLDCLRQFEHGS